TRLGKDCFARAEKRLPVPHSLGLHAEHPHHAEHAGGVPHWEGRRPSTFTSGSTPLYNRSRMRFSQLFHSCNSAPENPLVDSHACVSCILPSLEFYFHQKSSAAGGAD